MRYKIVIIVIAVICGFLFAEIARSADFTVDSRSLMHVGAAGTISATVNTFAVEAKIPQFDRNVIAFSTAFGAGLTKELFMDDSLDYGDVFFNGLGAIGGIYISEKYFILPSEKGLTVGGKF